ncbi:hypothetical protein [Chitinophaga tropicalis]|uniref:DUF2254 domain-containing protein n=1 Tax=Chitinophaga tropicalis TaxID=2683588 RepID=A0A7K1U1C4_9BACT|nr:hypothetical protein [Chitinophaga tropicalis]MVT07815.1 hypothetical protein [Chitinophaga tropicalis]
MGIRKRNSLRNNVKSRIISKYPEIAPHNFGWRRKIVNLLFSKKGYYLVIPFVFGLLCLLTFRFPFLDVIVFNDGTGATIIDQRTSNVATIISMTLAVIGLLLSNLAIKDSKSYRMAFVKSKLYFIIYYTLSVIVCLIIISTLRNTLSVDWFDRFVLAGTYLAITIPIAIAYLFGTIINFASSDSIMARFKEEYLSEIKAKIYIKLLTDYSRTDFVVLMNKLDIKEYKVDWGNVQDVTVVDEDPFISVKDVLIQDIDLPKLEGILTKYRGETQLFYTIELSINIATNEHQNYIWPKLKRKNGKNVDLSSCVSVVNPNKQLKVDSEFEDYFRDKLDEYIKDNKPQKVKEILNLFDDIYELQMKCL